MKIFVTTVLIALVLVAGGFWYARQNPDKLPDEVRDTLEVGQDTRADARGPQDYHILQDQGGIPRAEAERAGLITTRHAYLAAMEAIEQSEGIEQEQSIKLDSKLFDFGYRFSTTPPEMQVLEFNIQGEWDTLTFGFGFDDNEASDPTGKLAIELTVNGDGKALFGPQVISPVDEPIFTEVDVKGVRRVTFLSKRVGYNNNFSPVLLDPFVRKLPDTDPGQ